MTDDPSRSQPMPPRRWRRVAGGIALLAAALLAMRLTWGAIAQHRLNARLAVIAARGEPLTPAELFGSPDSYDDPANAVPLIEQAIASVMAVEASGIYSPAESNDSFPEAPPYPAGWHKLADGSVKANAQTFKTLRAARAKHTFHWRVNTTPPLFANAAIPSLNGARALANVTGDAALHAHVHGDDVEAIERVRDVFHLGESLHRRPMLIPHLVAIGIDSLALDRMQVIATGLKIERDDNAPIRKRVREMIDYLADERVTRDSLRIAIQAERVMQIDTVRWSTRSAWTTRPMYDLELARLMDIDDVLLRAATQPSVPASRELLTVLPPSDPTIYIPGLGRSPTPPRDPPRYTRQISTSLGSGLSRLVETDLRALLERSLTRIALAIQLYRVDHDGAWPPDLAALTPRYLPAIPSDPYTADGKPIGYIIVKHGLSDGGDRPLIYSIGQDFVDNSADPSKLQQTPAYGWVGHHKGDGDEYRDLTRWQGPPPPPTPTLSTSADDTTTSDSPATTRSAN